MKKCHKLPLVEHLVAARLTLEFALTEDAKQKTRGKTKTEVEGNGKGKMRKPKDQLPKARQKCILQKASVHDRTVRNHIVFVDA